MYLGDYLQSGIVNHHYGTYNTAGASANPTGSGTVQVFKGSSTTQITAGITHTVTFDSIVGIHHIRVDLGSTSDYAVGTDYSIVITSATIASQTVNAVVARFSIENRNNKADVRKLSGTVQSLSDLKDFADTGYNPTTHTVVKVDTCSANTDMRGTDNASTFDYTTNLVTLDSGTISSNTFDNSTAFPLKNADSGSTQVARTGADGDTLETLSDQIDDVPTVAEFNARTLPTANYFNPTSDLVTLDSGTISSNTFDNSTAFPLKKADSGTSAVARYNTGTVSLNTLNTRINTVSGTLNDMKGGTYNSATDSLEAIRNNMALETSVSSLTTLVNDVPTVAEFEARTLPTANYFNPSSDFVKLDSGTIGSNTYDNSTAYPLKKVDSGTSEVARYNTGTVSLNTLNSRVDTLSGTLDDIKGGTFDSSTDSLEAIRNNVSTFDHTTNLVKLESGTITSVKYDNSTAFPVKKADSGTSAIARYNTGTVSLNTLNTRINTVSGTLDGLPATADINTQMLDVMATDKQTDLSNAVPPTSATIVEMIKYCYAVVTGKVHQSATYKTFYNKSGTAIFRKACTGDATEVQEATATSGS